MSVDYNKLTVSALKEKLAERNLDTTGKKVDLIERLQKSDAEAQNDEEMEAEEVEEVDGDEKEAEEEECEAADESREGETGQEEYLDAEDEDALLGAEDELGEGGENMEENVDGEGEGEEGGEEAEEGGEEATEGGEEADGEQAEANEEADADEDKEHKSDTEKKDDDKEKDEEDMTEDPDFMERMKRRQKPYDVMKAKVDRIRDIRGRTVLVYPITTSDLSEDWLKEALQKSQQFFVRFFEYDCSRCEEGSMELRLKSVDEAKEVVASIKEKKENLQIRHLDPSDVVDKALMEMKGITEDPRLATSKRMLVVEDLSSNVKEDDLWGLFKDATYIFIPRDTSGNSKGYAYVDFKTEDDCRAVDFQYMDKPAEIEGKKLFIKPVWLGDGSHAQGMLGAQERDELRIKIRKLRARRQEALSAEDEKQVTEIAKEIGEIQWKLNRDSYLNKLSNRRDNRNRRPQQQKRKQPPPQQRQGGNKRPRQSWGSSQPPSLLDMPTRNRRGGYGGSSYSGGGYQRGGGGQRYGGGRGGGYGGRGGGGGSSSYSRPEPHPNSQAVQSLLVGLSQMLQGGSGGSSSGSYPTRASSPPRYSSRYAARDSYGGDYGGGYYDDHRGGRDDRDWRVSQASSAPYSSGAYGGRGGGRTQQYNRNRRY